MPRGVRKHKGENKERDICYLILQCISVFAILVRDQRSPHPDYCGVNTLPKSSWPELKIILGTEHSVGKSDDYHKPRIFRCPVRDTLTLSNNPNPEDVQLCQLTGSPERW